MIIDLSQPFSTSAAVYEESKVRWKAPETLMYHFTCRGAPSSDGHYPAPVTYDRQLARNDVVEIETSYTGWVIIECGPLPVGGSPTNGTTTGVESSGKDRFLYPSSSEMDARKISITFIH